MDKPKVTVIKDHGELEQIDWGTHSLELGVALWHSNEPWLALDLEALRALRNVLKLPTAVDIGHGFTQMGPLALRHQSLNELLAWVEAAIKWAEKQPEPPVKA